MIQLATDYVVLYPPAGADPHGWALPGPAPCWAGQGALQMAPGATDPRAADAGGRGPSDPASVPSATLYLPPAAAPADGMTAAVRGSRFALSAVRFIPDPTGTGGLDCWVATATGGLS